VLGLLLLELADLLLLLLLPQPLKTNDKLAAIPKNNASFLNPNFFILYPPIFLIGFLKPGWLIKCDTCK